LLATGKTRAIGVSNYSVKYLEELLQHCSVMPAVNQIENRQYTVLYEARRTADSLPDPYLPQQDIHDFCSSKGILVEAYSPLGSTGSPLSQEETVQNLAEHYRVRPATILISYQGMPAVRSLPQRSIANLAQLEKVTLCSLSR
jgi:glycerol 2-dehydrogenase (NADP+)